MQNKQASQSGSSTKLRASSGENYLSERPKNLRFSNPSQTTHMAILTPLSKIRPLSSNLNKPQRWGKHSLEKQHQESLEAPVFKSSEDDRAKRSEIR